MTLLLICMTYDFISQTALSVSHITVAYHIDGQHVAEECKQIIHLQDLCQ